jgi:DNA repair and recombination protein RAD54B
MFYKILNPDKIDDLIQSSTAESLALINILTKISNSPILLKATVDNAKNKKHGSVEPVKRSAVDDALNLLPAKAHIADMSLSGKFICHGLNDCNACSSTCRPGKMLSLATMLKMIRQVK